MHNTGLAISYKCRGWTRTESHSPTCCGSRWPSIFAWCSPCVKVRRTWFIRPCAWSTARTLWANRRRTATTFCTRRNWRTVYRGSLFRSTCPGLSSRGWHRWTCSSRCRIPLRSPRAPFWTRDTFCTSQQCQHLLKLVISIFLQSSFNSYIDNFS